MAHGQPDYSGTSQKITTYSLSDMAELAARLGSINTFDRRGDLVWYDDFEATLNKWVNNGNGTGHDADVSTTAARNGAQSCKIVTGSDGQLSGVIYAYAPELVKSKVGLEVHWTRPSFNWTYIYFRLQIIHSDYQWDARIKFQDSDASLHYWDGSAYQQIATGVGARSSAYQFLPLKFVVDLDNEVYERLLFQRTEYDLTSYALPSAAGSAITETVISIYSEGTAGNNVTGYVDDIILTQNEP